MHASTSYRPQPHLDSRPFSSAPLLDPHAALEALYDSSDPSSYLDNPPSAMLSAGTEPSSSSSSRTPSPLLDAEPRLLVRALFDYKATDPSALSFAAGDIIEVITQLESGWWDGMLDGERGWFPSNFVGEMTESELGRLEGAVDRAEMGNGDGEGNAKRGSALDIQDVLDRDQEDFGQEVGSSTWGDEGSGGLDALAREMMGGDDEDDASAFQQAATRRREGMEEFGMGVGEGRKREETERTITPLRTTDLDRPISGRRDTQGGALVDTWIPSLTPDGQIFYHNTLTGEDTWELPISTPHADTEDYYGSPNDDVEIFQPFANPAASASYAEPSSATASTPSSAFHPDRKPDTAGFAAPPKATGEIPYPWVSRLSDDGEEWYYYNRLTGETQRELPRGPGGGVVDLTQDVRSVGDGVDRLSLSSGSGYKPTRASVEVRKQAAADVQRRLEESLRAINAAKPRPTLGLLMDGVNDSLREIFEAAVAGSAAEEEMSRAQDLGSEAGMAAAVLREEGAVEMLIVAHSATLAAIRELLSAFGYVGPLDPVDEMPRPEWTGDMTLIGSIGLLSANTHAAVTSRRISESGLSVWQEVMRSASKLRDVAAMLPQGIFPRLEGAERDMAQSRSVKAWVGVETPDVAVPLGGKCGFSRSEVPLRALESSNVSEVQRLGAAIDHILRSSTYEDRLEEVLRLVERLREGICSIDLALNLDLDGDERERSKRDSTRLYSDLVDSARKSIGEVGRSLAVISHGAGLLFVGGDVALSTTDELREAVGVAGRAMGTLLHISNEQRHALASGLVPIGGHQFGQRSPLAPPLPARHSQGKRRPESMMSTASRGSRRGAPVGGRHGAFGLEEEFQDQEELRDRFAVPAGASGRASGGKGSAASSTTSLAYQQRESGEDGRSEAGSSSAATGKGSRNSILRFMSRGRAGSDADEGKGTLRSKHAGPSKKLAKIFGEDLNIIPTSVPPPSAGPSESPWFLGEDYEAGDIIFDDRGGVKAGTLKALVARLTPHGSTDTSFFQAFLLTFRSFTTPTELFAMLMDRYDLLPPPTLTEQQLQEWKKLKQTPIRLRVSNVLRSWLDVHYMESEDKDILDKVEDFARGRLAANGSELLSRQMLQLVLRRRQSEPDQQQSRRVHSGGLLSPPPSVPPRIPPGRDLRLTDIAPLELARQMTIMEFNDFQRIKPNECLHKAWNTSDGESKAPNVRTVIHTANVVSAWVSVMCLSSRDVKARAGIMKYFIQTAIELRNMNNFSSMAAIAAGLNSAPITRLKRTKELLSAKTQALKADLDRTLDSTKNFSNYKDMLKTINPPCVPFFGFWLSALTFIEDGNKDFVMRGTGQPVTANGSGGMTPSVSSSSLASISRGTVPPLSASASASSAAASPKTPGTGTTGMPLINFFKRSLSAEILRDIQQYQSQPYNLARCKPVYEFINRSLKVVMENMDQDRVYEISLQLEPREREEERITRMLHDSGFI